MRLNQIAQEIIEQNEHIEELERQLSELLERIDQLKHETVQRKCRVQELMFEAVCDAEVKFRVVLTCSCRGSKDSRLVFCF